MPALTVQGGQGGPAARSGRMRSTITTAETNQLKTGSGFVAAVTVWNVGTTATLDVYDNASANANKIFEWVSADGKNTFAIQCPVGAGIRVVTGGTFGGANISWT